MRRGFCLISRQPSVGFSNRFFLQKTKIHTQILNTKPSLCDLRGLRYLRNKMRFVTKAIVLNLHFFSCVSSSRNQKFTDRRTLTQLKFKDFNSNTTMIQGFRDLGFQRFRDLGIQECRDLEIKGIQGFRGLEILGFGDLGIWGFRDLGIYEFKDIGIQGFMDSGISNLGIQGFRDFHGF